MPAPDKLLHRRSFTGFWVCDGFSICLDSKHVPGFEHIRDLSMPGF